MKIKEYIDKNERALPKGLAELLLSETSIWTNDACYGYCVYALEKEGMSRQEIIRFISCLHGAFDELTVEEAEQKWRRF